MCDRREQGGDGEGRTQLELGARHADGALGVDDLGDLGDGGGVDLGVAVAEVGLRAGVGGKVSPGHEGGSKPDRQESGRTTPIPAVKSSFFSPFWSVTQTPWPSSMTVDGETQATGWQSVVGRRVVG